MMIMNKNNTVKIFYGAFLGIAFVYGLVLPFMWGNNPMSETGTLSLLCEDRKLFFWIWGILTSGSIILNTKYLYQRYNYKNKIFDALCIMGFISMCCVALTLGHSIADWNPKRLLHWIATGVFIAFTSIYGNTKNAAYKLKEVLESKSDVKVSIADLARDDMHECVEDAFRYDRLVLACPTYDGGLFPYMEKFINHLKSKNYQNRTVAFIENGSWAPISAKKMREEMSNLKNIKMLDEVVSIKSAVKEADLVQFEKLADALLA
jgi:flavodoxin